jgi:predicted enzyme related to lactoylglutathione lyase
MKIANAQLWVHDQEEALKFWTEKVGFEVRADVTMPEMVSEAPEERPYGIDAGFRDPSGNAIRLTQVAMSFNA